MSDVGYATLPIIPSLRGAQRTIDRELNGVGGHAGTREGEAFGRKFNQSASKSSGGLDFLKKIAKGAGLVTVGALAAGAAIAGVGIHGAASLETTTTSFTALLGSTSAATAQIKTLQAYAAKTPFKQQDVLGYAQQYYTLAGSVGLSKAKVTDFLDAVGNLGAVTGASSANIHNAVMAIGQIGSSGKVTLDNLNQISEAFPGFNGAAAIASATGQTTAQVMKQISAGTLDASTGVKALIEGMQKFPGAANAMEKQSQTLNGLWSTFTDTIQISLTQAFQPLIPVLKKSLGTVTPVISQTLTKLAPAISSFVSGFTKLLAPLISGLGTVLTSIFKALGPVLSALAPVIKPLADAFAHLVTAIAPLIKFAAQIIAQIGPPLIDIFNELITALAPVIKALVTALKPVLPIIAKALADLAAALAPVIKALAGAFIQVIEQLAPFLPDIAKSLARMAIAVAKLFVALTPLLTPLVKLLGLFTGAIARNIIGLANALAKVADGIRSVVDVVKSGGRALSGAWDAVTGKTGTIVGLDALNNRLREMRHEVGQAIGSALQLGATSIGGGLAAEISSLTDNANRLGGALYVAIARTQQLGSVGVGIGKAVNSAPKIPTVNIPSVGGGSSTGAASGGGSTRNPFDAGTLAAFLGTATNRGSNNPLVDALNAIFTSAKDAGKKFAHGVVDRLRSENNSLIRLTQQRSKIADQLAAATQNLSDLKGQRSDLVNSVSSAVTGTFDITKSGTSFDSILAQAKQAAANATVFANGLKTLAKGGLSPTLLQQLAQAGPSALPEVNALAAATPKQIAELNSQYKSLASSGDSLGHVIGDSMFKSGIDAAEGLIAGLKSKESAITQAIAKLADKMVAQIKRSLKIHSPSRVTRELGSFTGQGFALGLADEVPTVERHAKSIANASLPQKHVAAGFAARNGAGATGRDAPLIGHLEVNEVSDAVSTARAVTRRVAQLGAV